MKKGRLFVIAVCSLAVTVAIAAWIFNYQLLLLSKGFSLNEKTVITEGKDASGREFRIIGNSEEGKHSALALVKKGFAGIWFIEQYADERPSETRQLVVSTLNVIPDFSNPVRMPFEAIFVYAGDNAIRYLTVLSDLPDPDNSIVDISQNGRYYTVCITWRGYGTPYNGFSFYQYLKDRAYIE